MANKDYSKFNKSDGKPVKPKLLLTQVESQLMSIKLPSEKRQTDSLMGSFTDYGEKGFTFQKADFKSKPRINNIWENKDFTAWEFSQYLTPVYQAAVFPEGEYQWNVPPWKEIRFETPLVDWINPRFEDTDYPRPILSLPPGTQYEYPDPANQQELSPVTFVIPEGTPIPFLSLSLAPPVTISATKEDAKLTFTATLINLEGNSESLGFDTVIPFDVTARLLSAADGTEVGEGLLGVDFEIELPDNSGSLDSSVASKLGSGGSLFVPAGETSADIIVTSKNPDRNDIVEVTIALLPVFGFTNEFYPKDADLPFLATFSSTETGYIVPAAILNTLSFEYSDDLDTLGTLSVTFTPDSVIEVSPAYESVIDITPVFKEYCSIISDNAEYFYQESNPDILLKLAPGAVGSPGGSEGSGAYTLDIVVSQFESPETNPVDVTFTPAIEAMDGEKPSIFAWATEFLTVTIQPIKPEEPEPEEPEEPEEPQTYVIKVSAILINPDGAEGADLTVTRGEYTTLRLTITLEGELPPDTELPDMPLQKLLGGTAAYETDYTISLTPEITYEESTLTANLLTGWLAPDVNSTTIDVTVPITTLPVDATEEQREAKEITFSPITSDGQIYSWTTGQLIARIVAEALGILYNFKVLQPGGAVEGYGGEVGAGLPKIETVTVGSGDVVTGDGAASYFMPEPTEIYNCVTYIRVATPPTGSAITVRLRYSEGGAYATLTDEFLLTINPGQTRSFFTDFSQYLFRADSTILVDVLSVGSETPGTGLELIIGRKYYEGEDPGEWEPVGITNTGSGYFGALRKGSTYEYMFMDDTNGVTPLLFANTDYIRNVIVSFLTPQWRGMSLYFDDQNAVNTPIPGAPLVPDSPSHWNLSGTVNPVWSQPGFPASFGYRLTPITQFILSGGASGGQVGGFPYAFSRNKTIAVPSILANNNSSLHCRFTSTSSGSSHDTYVTNNSYTGRHLRLNSGTWGLFTTITDISVNTTGEAKVGKQQPDSSYTEPSSTVASTIVYSMTHYNNQTFKRQFMFADKDGKNSIEFEYPMFSEHSSTWNINYTPTNVTESMSGSGNTNRSFSTTIPLYANGNIPLRDIYQYSQSHIQNATHSWTTGTVNYNQKRYLTTSLQASTMTANMSSTLLVDSVIPRLLLQGEDCALVELTVTNQSGTEREYDSTPLGLNSPTTEYEKVDISTQDVRQPSITLLVMVKGTNYEITYGNCKSFFFTNYGWPEYHNTIAQQLDSIEFGNLSVPIDVSFGEWEFYPVFGTTERYATYYKLMNERKQVRYHPEARGSRNAWSFVENLNPFWVDPSYKVGVELHIVVATESKVYHCKGVLTSEGLEYNGSSVYPTDFCQFQITEYLDNAPYLLSAEQYSGVYVSSANDFTSFILSSFLDLINSTKTYSLYTVTDDQGNETVELAISQIPKQDEGYSSIVPVGQDIPPEVSAKEEWRADIYRFNTTSLKWERRLNGVSALSALSKPSEFISYHPNPHQGDIADQEVCDGN